MFKKRMIQMDNNLNILTTIFPILKKQFFEFHYSLTVVMEYCDKGIVKLVHLEDKDI
jgi:hypothetical protein